MRLAKRFRYGGMLDSCNTTVKSMWHQNKGESLFHSLEILLWLKRVITVVKLSDFYRYCS